MSKNVDKLTPVERIPLTVYEWAKCHLALLGPDGDAEKREILTVIAVTYKKSRKTAARHLAENPSIAQMFEGGSDAENR